MNVLAALLSLIQAHQQPQPQRTVNLVSNPKDQYYTPQQRQAAVAKAGPEFITPTGRYVGPLSPAPMPAPLMKAMDQAYQDRVNAELQTQPKVPNFRGALPPAMVNVPWSSQQMPYAQSLNPPKGFGGK